LNEKYASEIAEGWNTRDKASGYKGYVTKIFGCRRVYRTLTTVQTAGAGYHQELWIPAEELDEFNRHIIGILKWFKAFKRIGRTAFTAIYSQYCAQMDIGRTSNHAVAAEGFTAPLSGGNTRREMKMAVLLFKGAGNGGFTGRAAIRISLGI
jgi:hypothetical protein